MIASIRSAQASAARRGKRQRAAVAGAPPPGDRVAIGATAAVPSPAPSSSLTDRANTVALAATASAVGVAAGSAVAAGVYAGLKSGFVTGYLAPSDALQKARDLAARYPDLVEIVERPYQTHGYDGQRADLQGPAPLWHMRIGPRNAPDRDQKVGVLQMSAPHAREWNQPMILLELAEELLANYDPSSADPAVQANTKLLADLDIFIVPVTNPDGQNYSFFDDDMWRKNRSPQPDGGIGVDGNRNFPYKWDKGTKSRSQTFAGPSAASEAETRNVLQIVDDHPNIRFVCDWHSYGEEVRRPYGISDADRAIYERLQNRMAEAIETVRGHRYKVNDSKVIHGASDDYFYQEKGLFSAIIEDGQEFHGSVNEALQVMREGVAGARELLAVAQEYAGSHGLEKAHPPAIKPDDPPPEKD